MTPFLAIVAGTLMTAVAVAIAGLVLETILLALSRSLMPPVAPPISAEPAAVIHLDRANNSVGTMEWAEEAAA
jgi:hypothetical protein